MALRVEPFIEIIAGYRLLERLGGGGFGEVWKAEAPGGFHKAVKVIHGDINASHTDENRHAEQELRALQRIQAVRHPFLLSLERYDIVQGRLVIVMELADCNLWERFRVFADRGEPGIPREELLRFMEESAEVLDLMNIQHQIQHLDIKPQNLFLLHNHIKVGDFGLAKDLEGTDAVITGGVTPVYAAPETFDGSISKSCDQYSLAIVYQELLTGKRPFQGTALKQLLTQHMESPPDLSSLPEQERPAVARALSKKPGDRYATCTDFVKALRNAGQPSPAAAMAQRAAPRKPRPASPSDEAALTVMPDEASSTPLRREPKPEAKNLRHDSSGLIDLSSFTRPTPTEEHGPGALMPTLLIGVGGVGATVLNYLRLDLRDRFGSPSNLPSLRMLAVDTDAESLRQPGGLSSDEVLHARLSRTGHYMQARRSGRSLIDGWMEPQLLHRIPRQHPNTCGLRAIGRLAFCDHVKAISNSMVKSLIQITDPESLRLADQHTGLGQRTNKPRVYVVAHLGGGAGAGMFLDAAYSAKHRLKQLGYIDPEVVGLLILPPEGGDERASVNAYAALTELHHFSTQGTKFKGGYDDRDADFVDHGPPFARCILLASRPAADGGHSGFEFDEGVIIDAIDHLRRELTTPFGRKCDEERERFGTWDDDPGIDRNGPVFQTFGVEAYSWPKQQALAKAAQRLSQHLLHLWRDVPTNRDSVSDPSPSQLPPIPVGELKGRAAQTATSIAEAVGVTGESLLTRLNQEVKEARGEDPREQFDALAKEATAGPGAGSMLGKMFARGADPDKVWPSLQKIQKIVGMPDAIGLQGGRPGKVEPAVAQAGVLLEETLGDHLMNRLSGLLEQPDYRLFGADLVCQTIRRELDETIDRHEALWRELSEKSTEAFFVVNGVLSPEKGKRPSAREISEALRTFGRGRYEATLLKELCRVAEQLRGRVDTLTREIEFARRQLGEVSDYLEAAVQDTGMATDADLLPEGCANLDDVASRLMANLSIDDVRVLDRQVQTGIEAEFDSLYRACATNLSRQEELAEVLFEKSRLFLDHRLGDADVVDMFFRRYPSRDQVVAMIQRAYQSAAPTLFAADARPEFCIMGLPPGEQGEPFQLLAQRAFGAIDLTLVTHPDEILFYRESPYISITDLPQFGPDIAAAYERVARSDSATPHSRVDIDFGVAQE